MASNKIVPYGKAMHAFDFIVLFFSFVYAAAITHLLATTGEIIIEAKRIKLSWLNAGWMLVSLLATCAWWIGLWDLREVKVWTIGLIAFFFLMASALYLLARMVSPRIAHDGEIDLVAFHSARGPEVHRRVRWNCCFDRVDQQPGWTGRGRGAVADAELRRWPDDVGGDRCSNLHPKHPDPDRRPGRGASRVDGILRIPAVIAQRIANAPDLG